MSDTLSLIGDEQVEAHLADIFAQDAAIKHQNRVAQILNYSGLSLEHRAQTFDNFIANRDGADNSAALRLCRSYSQHFEPRSGIGCLLYGPKGIGKDHLVSATMQGLAQREIPVVRLSVPKLLIEFRTSFAQETFEKLMRTIQKNEVIALREFFIAANTAFEMAKAFEMLYAVIDSISDQNKGLLVTTNLSPPEIGRRLNEIDPDERLADRLAGCCELVPMQGQSYRRELREQRRPAWLS